MHYASDSKNKSLSNKRYTKVHFAIYFKAVGDLRLSIGIVQNQNKE